MRTGWMNLLILPPSGKSAVVGSTTRELLGTSAEAWGKAKERDEDRNERIATEDISAAAA